MAQQTSNRKHSARSTEPEAPVWTKAHEAQSRRRGGAGWESSFTALGQARKQPCLTWSMPVSVARMRTQLRPARPTS